MAIDIFLSEEEIQSKIKELAAKIAVSAVTEALKDTENIEKVIFCVFDEENLEIYRDVLKKNEEAS